MIYLFTGKTRLARQTRLDFYEMMSELYENSFFGQISNFCAKASIPFSGHILLEDDIRYHPVFEGNYFSLMRHMHYPGIDMLSGRPEDTRANAFTPKLISSVAHTYNRPHVMSEISAHSQGGKVTPGQMLGNTVAQYALGVDVFTSYSRDSFRPIKLRVLRSVAVDRHGATHSDIAVFIHRDIADYSPRKEFLAALYPKPRLRQVARTVTICSAISLISIPICRT